MINLRGAQPGESWYDIEKAVSDELGLQRVNIAMSVSRIPHRGRPDHLAGCLQSTPPADSQARPFSIVVDDER